jgi:hypothetical protein
VYSLEY